MLSKYDIRKELGYGLAVVPFIEDNLKENSINLSASKYAWTSVSGNYFFVDELNWPLYIREEDIPNEKKNRYILKHIGKGDSAVINKGGKEEIILFPHSTTYVETLEVLSTNGKIGGTCHSKVGTAAEGIGHIGTMMGPNYSGHCFVPLHNPTDSIIELAVGDTFMSVVFNYLDTPLEERNATTGAHTDKFASLGIHASREVLEVLNQDWKRLHQTVVEKLKMDPAFLQFKQRLKRQKRSKFFTKKNVLLVCIILIVMIVLGILAQFLDSRNGTNLWGDRYWSVLGAGLIVSIFQYIFDKLK